MGITVAPRNALSSLSSLAAVWGGSPSSARRRWSAVGAPCGPNGPNGPELPVQLTVLPQIGAAVNPSSSTLLSALALGVAIVKLIAGSSPATTVPRNTASTSPLTDRKAAFGLSASRRAASSEDVPFMNLPSRRAAGLRRGQVQPHDE